MRKYRLEIFVGFAIAPIVLLPTHAPNIADAAQLKPAAQPPRIIVRPPNVTPHSRKLLKKKDPSEVTDPASTQGGSATASDSPVQSQTPSHLRRQNRLTAPIPRLRPNDRAAEILLQRERKRAELEQKVDAMRDEALENFITSVVVAIIQAIINIFSTEDGPLTVALRAAYLAIGQAIYTIAPGDGAASVEDEELSTNLPSITSNRSDVETAEMNQAEIESAMAEQEEEEAEQDADAARDFIKDVMEKLESVKREESRTKSALSGISD